MAKSKTVKDQKLIFDVGLHRGQDTDFYLRKGFRVVAFEADPDNAAFCRDRFAAALADGRLTIVEGAITERFPGSDWSPVVKFYRNEDHSLWGSTSEDWAVRNTVLGTTNEVIGVTAVDFAAELEKHGVPHYLKADIVGSEMICLRALLDFENKPDFLSIRSEKLVFNRLVYEFDLLEKLGYRDFKVIKQDFEEMTFEFPDETYRWEEGASGPFGEDTSGPWKDRERALADYRRIFIRYWLFGDYSYLIQTERGRKFIALIERLTKRSVPGWYDTHARHESMLSR